MDLFTSEKNNTPLKIALTDAEITYYPSFFTSEKASEYFQILLDEIEWQQDDIKIFGKIYKQPRLTSLYGINDASYRYSGITMFPKPFNSVLKEIKTRIEESTDVKFTTVLLNYYRDGSDSNGWHSDDEKELGENPVIASISLGAERTFRLRHKKDKTQKKNLTLQNGSLLLMAGETQHHWQHCIPKSKKDIKPRINLTFRVIK
ncbi:MAG: alkylated DNA repair dioxygenase AlkB [Ulvibacter sp.]